MPGNKNCQLSPVAILCEMNHIIIHSLMFTKIGKVLLNFSGKRWEMIDEMSLYITICAKLNEI